MDPRTFLDRWIGRPAPSPALASALEDLGRLGSDRPELSGPSASLAALLVAAFRDVGPPADWSPSPEPLAVGWRDGRPAFHVAPPDLEQSRLVARMRRIVHALGSEADGAAALGRAIRSRKIDVMGWIAEALAGRGGEVARRAESIGLDPALASSVLRLTLLPSLAGPSAVLDRLRPEDAWGRGDCPNCGSRPLLAESRGLEQRIYFRCGLCAADWAGDRLGCPSCGEARPKSLHVSYVEGEQDRCRWTHCDACRYDWKVVSTLTALSPPAMIVADLATIHLDLLAEEARAGQGG